LYVRASPDTIIISHHHPITIVQYAQRSVCFGLSFVQPAQQKHLLFTIRSQSIHNHSQKVYKLFIVHIWLGIPNSETALKVYKEFTNRTIRSHFRHNVHKKFIKFTNCLQSRGIFTNCLQNLQIINNFPAIYFLHKKRGDISGKFVQSAQPNRRAWLQFPPK
jgi:hypothetical protein